MRELSELKTGLAEELEESFRHGVITNIPRSPMAVIYQDSGARRAKEQIDLIFQSIWGDKRKAIVQLVMDNGAFQDADSGEALTTEDVQERIDEMYADDGSFRNMNRLRVFLLLDTGSYSEPEAFQRAYEQVRQVQGFITDGLLTTAIVLLDESTRNKQTANAIREYLRTLLDNQTHFHSSTILLSNRLSSGALLAGRRIQENYAMAGWIILLANSIGAGYAPDDTVFYPIGQRTYLTAAFSEITRPNKDICDIVLHTIFNWIDRQIQNNGSMAHDRIDLEDLYQRLEISGGKAQVLDGFYRDSIAERLPTWEAFRFLPRLRPEQEDFRTKTFAALDQECMGGCAAFFESICSSFLNKRQESEFRKYVQSYLRKRLSAAERENVLTAANAQKLLHLLQPKEPGEQLRFDHYLEEKSYAAYLNWALPIFQDVLQKEQKFASEYAKEFESILREFQQGYFPDNPDLERYYTGITNEILESASGRLGVRLLEETGANSKDRSALLDCFRRAVEEIFSERAIFHMPLEQEMVNRMGQNPHDVHNQIYNMLFKDLDGRIRLKTALTPTEQKQITIVNQHRKDGTDTELYRSIQKNVSDAAAMTYFDSCNSNSIKIIRFYSCDSANLI